jgi:hypothetical protein
VLPRALTQGLEPSRVGLLSENYDQALRAAVADRETAIAGKLEVLRHWYGVAPGPNCWRDLCLAMARERFPGFRVKAGRKPPKWTMGVLWILAGEMRRVMDAGAQTQEDAAQHLAERDPWKAFLERGRWKGKAIPRDRHGWENLLNEYTRMPKGYRAIGEDAYRYHVLKGTVDEWDRQVQDFLEHPAAEEK